MIFFFGGLERLASCYLISNIRGLKRGEYRRVYEEVASGFVYSLINTLT